MKGRVTGMVTRRDAQKVDVRKEVRGGNGEVIFRELLAREHFHGHGRLFSMLTLEPGCLIGWHVHEAESEVCWILRGKARYNDNGKKVTLFPGDTAYCPSGQGHQIENIGKEPLEFIALIVNA